MSFWWSLAITLVAVIGGGLLVLWGLVVDDGEHVLGLVGAILGILIAVFGPCAAWALYSPHPGAPCIHSHEETSYIYSGGKYGGVMFPVTDSACDEWGPKR